MHEKEEIFKIINEKEIDGENWVIISWLGSLEKVEFRKMMNQVFFELREHAVFSSKTRRLFIRQESLNEFNRIIESYREKFLFENEIQDKLDDAFDK